jgi:hypothetical protein
MPIVGRDAKIYYSTAALPSPTWNLITLARGVTLNMENVEAEIRDRSSAYAKTLLGLKDVNIEFSMTYVPTDAAYIALLAAWENGTDIAIAVMDEAIATVGAEGFQAACKVMNFSRNEGLEDSVSVDVTLRPSAANSTAPNLVEVT